MRPCLSVSPRWHMNYLGAERQPPIYVLLQRRLPVVRTAPQSARTALWASQAAFQARQRESSPARPHQGLHVQFFSVDAFAARLGARAVRAAVHAAGDDAPTQRMGLSNGLDPVRTKENMKARSQWGQVVHSGNGAFHSISLAPHPAHLRPDIYGLARSTILFTHRLRWRPRPALELVQHRIRN
jgi:hypothetical protein